MKKLLIALAMLPALACADNGAYVGVQYSNVDAEEVSLGALGLQAGYQFSEYLSAEGRMGVGISDDTYMGVDIELNNYFGAYLKAQYPTASGFSPYALLGYSKGELEASFQGESLSEDESDMSYGVGVEYDLGNRFLLGVEYLVLIDKDGYEINNLSFGGRYRF
ncbi:porin family protein [uncultured Ferrimonas sp.]|uniref:porin family protein n=1 Tax=uncultured Ferrimonas sp. TaxID=432640 RepID=UPI002634C59C|nr:porin family protein [uncultured Ferrimonas sp.]